MTLSGVVEAVAASPGHTFGKPNRASVRLVAGLGVEGDAHAGATVKHRSRGAAGELGENVTTRGLDLLALPRGALLRLGAEAVIEVTGLRNPCAQLERFRLPGREPARLRGRLGGTRVPSSNGSDWG